MYDTEKESWFHIVADKCTNGIYNFLLYTYSQERPSRGTIHTPPLNRSPLATI